MMEKHLKSQFEFTNGALLTRAPAKINLYLLVADKRPDGFHNIETLMAKITFYDELIFEVDKAKDVELVCNGLWSPAGEDNLVYKAARLFYESVKKEPQIRITLTKNIPAGSGLGGASSDAAATLLALNKLHNQSLNNSQLHKLAERLGSDVPFFLDGPQALCTGRGEKILKEDNISPFLAIVMLPNLSVSTKTIYDNFKVDLGRFEVLKEQIKPLLSKNRVDLVQKICANMLAKTCFAINNELALLKTEIENICHLPASLSGSGSALFVLLADRDYRKAEYLRREIESLLDCNCIIVFNNQW